MTNEPYNRLGPVHLQPGVTRGHATTLLFAAFVSIGLLTFFKTMQPYLFNVTLHVPASEQGRITGILEFLQEIVVLLAIGPFGALADRIGRRPVFALGFVLLGVGYALFPFATSLVEFSIYRSIFALGAAASGGMLATVLADYPQERSREPMVAMTFILNGLGIVLFAVVLAKLPIWIQAGGTGEIAAGRYTLLIVAAICIVAALAMRGLKPGVPAQRPAKEPLMTLMKKGMAAGRNPRIALAYGTAFASRGDIAVVGTYLLLWSSLSATQAGASPAEAAVKAGILTAITQSTALVWAGLFGYLASKMHRVTSIVVAMVLATIGYLAFGLVEDPNSRDAIPAAAMLGIGQMSAILSSQVLIGQEAPREVSGSVIGVYGFFGALGILIVSLASGLLFDAWRPGAPFLIMAGANFALLVWAVAVRRLAPGPARVVLAKEAR